MARPPFECFSDRIRWVTTKRYAFTLLSLMALLGAKAKAAPPAAKNLMPNGDFLSVVAQDNLWDGVDEKGFLSAKLDDVSVPESSVPLLDFSGALAGTVVPVSVALVDINGDGLPDLLVASPSGYVFAYINSGTKTEPKFTNGELLPLQLARDYFRAPNGQVDWGKTVTWRKAPRITFCDWSHNGVMDMLVGNYRGELLFFPNKGSRTNPVFVQPDSLASANLISFKNLWGNLFAPVVYDFNGDGKLDIAFGEGSYSANSIHLFLNQGSNGQPKFDESQHYIVAYGDGKEDLVPTLADYNGDGNMDLLVGDREGRVAVYLNPGKDWKPGQEFKFSNYIDFGGTEKLGGAVAPFAGDINGDGLFDLIIGKSDGHIAVAINQGTKEAPKFGAPVDLKGVDLWGRNIKIPARGYHDLERNRDYNYAGWTVDSGFRHGNTYGYFSVVTAKDEPTAGIQGDLHALKAGYFPSPNKVFKPIMPIFPGMSEKESNNNNRFYGDPRSDGGDASNRGGACASNEFVIRCILPENTLGTGKNYHLTFNVKGANFEKGVWAFAYQARTGSQEKITHGERGSAQRSTSGLKWEQNAEEGAFTASSNWTTIDRPISVHFKDSDLKNPGKVEAVMGLFEIRALLRPNDGVMYVDNVQLVETP